MKGTNMKKVFTIVGGVAGLLYGGSAVVFAYPDAPLDLQAFIIAGVAAVGASTGWLVGFLASLLPAKR
jgi:hypothetical protein